MLAIVIDRPGGPEVLAVREVADPEPGPDEVRVRVRAAGLNRADLLQRRGRYPAPPGSPRDIPGLEFAGEVETCGCRVASLRPGDRVMGILGGGAHAERVVAHERACLPVPPSLDFVSAAAVPEAFLTAFDAIVVRGGLCPGESVLVDAAGSGVGTAATQLARVAGGRTIALSRSPAKRRRIEELGADRVLDPCASDVEQAILLAAGGAGVDLVVDLVGAATWERNLRVLAPRGRLVVVGLLGGSRVELDLARVLARRITVAGTVLRTRSIEEKLDLTQSFAARIVPLVASGRLRPVVDRVFPFAEAASAHARMESNENFGKIVLVP